METSLGLFSRKHILAVSGNLGMYEKSFNIMGLIGNAVSLWSFKFPPSPNWVIYGKVRATDIINTSTKKGVIILQLIFECVKVGNLY